MKSEGSQLTKELYNELRRLSCERLWMEEVVAFDKASPAERIANVALVRAVGVVFSESGTEEQKSQIRGWLVGLLKDPEEKIRRYAITALPKLEAGPEEEAALLDLLKSTTNDREKKFLGETLDKIGGTATLEALRETRALSPQTEQKVKASVAREQRPSAIRGNGMLSDFSGFRIHLRCRKGLEGILRDEVQEVMSGKFRIKDVTSGLVVVTALAPFSLAEVYTLRCFATMGFVIGISTATDEEESVEALASLITSPLARRLMKCFTEGAIRYRLDFIARGHLRGAVRLVANRAYALCPDILNDARSAPWSVDVHPSASGDSIELRPRISPDPRHYFRQDEVPASSHPPLAACMARLAGKNGREVVWDPFCGSGLELIERTLLGGVKAAYGTDRNAAAIEAAEANFSAAKLPAIRADLVCCDFRDFESIDGLEAGAVTLIITNPPMGKRVPIHNLRRLIEDLFGVADAVLKENGRLVFANPLQVRSPYPGLKLEYRQLVDFGGFNCHLEMYRKLPHVQKRRPQRREGNPAQRPERRPENDRRPPRPR